MAKETQLLKAFRRWWALHGPMATLMRPADRLVFSRTQGHWPTDSELDAWILSGYDFE